MSRMMLLLHSHIPYVKHQGRWPFGEIWLFEAMAETYVPLLDMLQRLAREGIRPGLAFSFSPTLLDQLASPYIREEFVRYLLDTEERARSDRRYYDSMGIADYAALAAYYERYYRDIRMQFLTEYGQDLAGAFLQHQKDGHIEIVATAATHAYLPLVDPASIDLQVYLGRLTYEKHFRCSPAGFWLPECGYKNGLEEALQAHGFSYFFVDSHAVEGGKPHGDGSPSRTPLKPEVEFFADTGLSTYRPYRVMGSDFIVLGRNAMVSQQVWSADTGYPGDACYREYHQASNRSGFKYWRVTNRKGQGAKAIYNPSAAARRANQQARHFVDSVSNTVFHARKIGVEQPLIVGCYDTELFGHWWWEGPRWLEAVIRLIDRHHDLELCLPGTVSSPRQDALLFESSWGMGGKHFIWENEETLWMWELTREVCEDCWKLIRHDASSEIEARSITQAVKELLLLESSDWFFMVSNNLTRDYAMKRFFEHYTRLLRLNSAIQNGCREPNLPEWLARVEYEDDFLTGLRYHEIRNSLCTTL